MIASGRASAARWVALLVLALGASSARAQTPTPTPAAPPAATEPPPPAPVGKPRVALLSAATDDPLAGRIEAELESLGFEVSRAPIPPETELAEVVRRLLAGGVRAAIVAGGHRTDLWIGENGTDRVALREEMEVNETSGMRAVLALRTVEFLRISLGIGGPSVLPVTAEAVPTITRAPSVFGPAEERWWAADVSSGVLATSGGLGPFVVVGAGVRARLLGPFGLEAHGYAPLTSDAVTDVEADHQGQSHTTAWLVGGGVAFVPRMRRVAFEGAVGAMAVIVHSTGAVSGPSDRAGPSSQAIGAGYARAALRVRLASRFAVRLDVLAGATFGRVVLPNIAGTQDLAAFGPAFGAVLGGAEMRF